MRRLCVVLLTCVTALGGLVMAPTSASADSYGPGSLVKDVPIAGTPHVLDGRVSSIAKVGNTIILGGAFSQTRNNDSTTVIARSRLVAFDITTKQISTTFAPNPNGDVEVVLPAADGKSVYVGGSFSTIAGAAVKNLAQVNVADGSLVTTFNPATVDGRVLDLRLSNNRLWVAGAFTHVAGKAQRALATVNPITGKFDAFMKQVISGLHNGGTTTVQKIDINSQGTRLIALGNFDAIDASKHHQLLMLDLSGHGLDDRQLADRVLRDRLLEVVQQLHARPGLLPRRHLLRRRHHRCVRRRRHRVRQHRPLRDQRCRLGHQGLVDRQHRWRHDVLRRDHRLRRLHRRPRPLAEQRRSPPTPPARVRSRVPASPRSTRSTACRSRGTPPVTAASASSTSS